MWELWAESERSLHDAELARDRWYDGTFRRALRTEPEVAVRQFRLSAKRPDIRDEHVAGAAAAWWGRFSARLLSR